MSVAIGLVRAHWPETRIGAMVSLSDDEIVVSGVVDESLPHAVSPSVATHARPIIARFIPDVMLFFLFLVGEV